MTKGAKSMIAGCIDRFSEDACGGCERRDACSELFAQLFGSMPRAKRTPPPRESASRTPLRSLIFSVLGEVARSVQSEVHTRRRAPEQAEPPRRKSAPSAATPEARGAQPPGPFQSEVERHLEPLLASGPLGIDSVARELGYSRQTLYRRLKAEGVTYEVVLDTLRQRLALRLLREEGLSVKETAWRLGFSDPAAFSRAFKRWTGSSPTTGRGT